MFCSFYSDVVSVLVQYIQCKCFETCPALHSDSLFLCSGIEDDSGSLMQQKLEKQVKKSKRVPAQAEHDSSFHCLFLPVKKSI